MTTMSQARRPCTDSCRQILEDELQQEGIPLGLVADQGASDLAELAIRETLPRLDQRAQSMTRQDTS